MSIWMLRTTNQTLFRIEALLKKILSRLPNPAVSGELVLGRPISK
jgi:hypothetical protein